MNDQELMIRYGISKLENQGIKIPSDPTIELFDLAMIFLKFLFLSGDYILPPGYTQNILFDIVSKAIITMPLSSTWASLGIRQSLLHDPISPDIIEEP